jgi:SAM-dependent methyltransferase
VAICADVERHAFAPASFDLVFSRLGVMFFADPAAAFANVHKAMKPGGRMTLAVFRTQRENPWPSAPQQAVAHLLPPPPPDRPNTAAMFSLGDPDRVHRILDRAGFRDVSLTPVDLDYLIAGSDGGAAEAAEFAMLFGPLTRILPELGPERRADVRTALEIFFLSHTTPQGVALPAAFWVVLARA